MILVSYKIKISKALLAALSLSLLAPSFLFAEDFPLGYPGSSWGKLVHDNDEVSGNGKQWDMTQGIDWYRFPGDIVLNTFGAFNHRSRENNTLYYNSEGPAAGIELSKGPIDLGYEYYKERFPKLQKTSHNRAYYLKGYFSWEHIMLSNGIKFPGSFWFETTRDINGLNGSGVQLSINQGINLYEFSNNADFIAYVEYSHRSRDKNQKYYDANGPSAGLEIEYSSFQSGVSYYWESLPHLNEYSPRFQIYFSWYLSWDLKSRIKSQPKVDKPKILAPLKIVAKEKPKIKKEPIVEKQEKAVVEEPQWIIEAPDDKDVVRNLVEDWLASLNPNNIDKYASFYSADFLSAMGDDKDEYVKNKKADFGNLKTKELTIGNFAISIKDDTAEVVFSLSSGDAGKPKWIRLVWGKYSNNWKILYERHSTKKLSVAF